MKTEKLDSEIKTTISVAQKKHLRQLAQVRNVKPSDLIREALREWIAKQ